MNLSYTKCPKCDTLNSYYGSFPGDVDRVEFWSDGFSVDSERRDIIDFTKCPVCSAFFMLNENSVAKPEAGEVKSLENYWVIDDASIKEIDFIKEAFKAGLANTAEAEVYLRTKMWQAINNIMRKHDSLSILKKIRIKFFESSDFKESQKLYNNLSSLKRNNLIRLSNLLKMDQKENNNFILFAELYRELGDFSKAMIFGHRAETSSQVDSNRIALLKQNITSKSKAAYKI